MEGRFDTSKCFPAYCEDSLDRGLRGLLSELQLDAAAAFRLGSDYRLRISSAFRTTAYELARGRDGSSSHCKGLAVDIFCKDNKERFALVSTALKLGFVRIGIGKSFIHLDIDGEKPDPRIWLY